MEGPTKLFEDFEYVHAIENPDEPTAALIFRTRVGDRWMDGLDLLTFDEDGLITEMKVMLRPEERRRRDGGRDGASASRSSASASPAPDHLVPAPP